MILDSVIYEEEFDVYENELLLEKAEHQTNMYIDLMYFESSDESAGEKIKAVIHKVIEMFKAFINKCKEYLKSAINKITGRVVDVYTEHKIKEILRDFDKNLNKAEKLGLKTFKFIDIKALYDCINDEYNEFTDLVRKFVRVYIKRAAPKDAEKMVKKLQEISQKYDIKLKNILNEKKEYNIREAKKIVLMIENSKSARNGGFTDIAKKYTEVCDEIERLMVNTLNSLDQYSEDTGYVQNAKTLQDIIRNSSIRLQTHSAECITAVLKYGIPLICYIDKHANTHEVDTGTMSKDGLKVYEQIDLSTDKHQKARDNISKVSEHIGSLSEIELKAIRKVSRSKEIKDWKFTKGESPLTFDKNPTKTEDIIQGSMDAAPAMARHEVARAAKAVYGDKVKDVVSNKAKEMVNKKKS